MMKFIIKIAENEMLHPSYGVIKHDFASRMDVCCFIPFNLILRPLYLFWIWIHYWPKRTRLEYEVFRVDRENQKK